MIYRNFIIGVLFSSMFILTGCKSVEYVQVPVETIKTEYKVKKDSIYLHDSINVYTQVKGDTVYINTLKYKIKNTVKTDTVIKQDTIPKIVEITKIQEVNKLYSWQKALMIVGGVGVFIFVGLILNRLKIWKSLF